MEPKDEQGRADYAPQNHEDTKKKQGIRQVGARLT